MTPTYLLAKLERCLELVDEIGDLERDDVVAHDLRLSELRLELERATRRLERRQLALGALEVIVRRRLRLDRALMLLGRVARWHVWGEIAKPEELLRLEERAEGWAAEPDPDFAEAEAAAKKAFVRVRDQIKPQLEQFKGADEVTP